MLSCVAQKINLSYINLTYIGSCNDSSKLPLFETNAITDPFRCRKPKIPENALECHEYIEDENVGMYNECTRLYIL